MVFAEIPDTPLAVALRATAGPGSACPAGGGVELRIPPSARNVRTARLVAAAVARRSGLDPARVDELRLAVGEACARAVRRCIALGSTAPVVLRIEDDGPGLAVEVLDQAPAGLAEDPIVLALIGGLVDSFEVSGADPVGESAAGAEGTGGGRIRMEWWPDNDDRA